VFALPLQLGAIRLGALDLYRGWPGSLDAGELADALVYADTAGMLLLDAAGDPGAQAEGRAWPWHDPNGDQDVVHQATGMLLVQLGVSAETAFVRLRALAYARGLPLAAVAREVVGRRLRLEPDPPHGRRPRAPRTNVGRG
jgi:hypothetical protein